MLHHTDYYRAIALGIDAENKKASVYITHNPSLGVAREIILRDVLFDATPAPYHIRTGLIHGTVKRRVKSSRQCDVLVYNPTVNPPKYSFDNFVVLDQGTANVVVEVKSSLKNSEFRQVLDVMKSTWQFCIPTLAFAYESVKFATLLKYFSDAAATRNRDIPWCTAVHTNNYIAVRPRTLSSSHLRYDLVIDCSAAKETHHGMATAIFLQLYDAWLRKQEMLTSEDLYNWYNSLTDIPDKCRAYIAEDGTISYGAIP